MKNSLTIVLCTLMCAWLMVACQPNMIEEVASDKKVFQPSEDKYLEFASQAEFQQTLNELSRKTEDQIDAWERERGFVSLRKRFKEIVVAEEKNAATGLAPLKSNEAQLFTSAYIPSEEGGIEPNLVDWRMMPVVNPAGIVKVGKMLLQYRRAITKSILDDPNRDGELAILETATQSNSDLKLEVNPVISSRHYLPNSNARYTTRSCESASGSPMEWRMIAYEEVWEYEEGGEEYQCKNVLKYNATSGLYELTLECGTVYVPNLKQSCVQLKVRTLQRGAFGSWNNRSTGTQKASGRWKLAAGSVLAAGWSSGNAGHVVDPFQNNNYTVTNTSGSTSTMTWTFLYSSKASSGNSNIAFDQSSYHDPYWDGYGCQCHI